MADLQGEIFGRELDDILVGTEESIQTQLAPFVDQLLERVDGLLAAGTEIDDALLEEITAPVNDAAARIIASELDALQPSITNLAGRWGETEPARFIPGTLLLELASMDGTSLTEWFERKSPSKWMEGLQRALRKGINDGWDRHREATGKSISTLIQTLAETATWSSANGQLISAWSAREFKWQTRQDELVCEICGPKDGTIFSGASNGPPAHPRCRCVSLPDSVR